MLICGACWLLPIARPPVRDGWVAVEAGRIAAVGGPQDEPPAGRRRDIGHPAAILPALVNAHTHLELSWMAGQVPPAAHMPAWAARLIAVRRAKGGDAVEPIAAAIEAAQASGTALVGDIGNTAAAWEPLRASGMFACCFRELLGFATPDPQGLVEAAVREIAAQPHSDRLRMHVTAHAPYSVSPALFRAISEAGGILSVHLGESADEVEFLRAGEGAWRGVLETLGAWNPDWAAPGCGPVEYLDRLGLVSARLLAVHGVHLADGELRRLADAGATLVACPRSNRWTGAGAPPLERFYAAGVPVAFGTDSLAGVEDLNLFAELAAARALAPDVPASRLLASATATGARALGFGRELGTIEPGRRAELLAVRIPADCMDVEEYLVGGVEPKDITWLDRE